MAIIYNPPKDLGEVPKIIDFLSEDGRFDREEYNKAETEYEKKLRTWCSSHNKDKYAGTIIKEPVADGYAMYMILTTKPAALFHLPFGDAYEFRWAHRWTASDIKSLADQEKRLQSVFGRDEAV
jgi:hypothetical protein